MHSSDNRLMIDRLMPQLSLSRKKKRGEEDIGRETSDYIAGLNYSLRLLFQQVSVDKDIELVCTFHSRWTALHHSVHKVGGTSCAV